MRKYTLQARITLIVGLILTASCLFLTINSLISARTYYGDYMELLEEGMIEYDPVLPEGTLPPAINPTLYYQDASQKFSIHSAIAMVLIAVLGLAAAYWAAGRVLKPLNELTRSVRGVDDRHLDRRVNSQGAQGEVLELTQSFNGLLERLEQAFLIQKSFASNAAHELKTPLAVMKTSLQVMKMDPNPGEEDFREFIHDTEKSLERIIKTVEGLLTLANPEDIVMDSSLQLYPLLEQAADELSDMAGARGVSLSVAGEKGVTVRGSQTLLYRVLFNLIENAVKYNRDGGAVMAAVNQEGSHVRVRVEDNGVGMDEETLLHIFEPFYRADPSRSQQIPGSGLGLAVVKLILERHGGEIHVQSREGCGTVFTVIL